VLLTRVTPTLSFFLMLPFPLPVVRIVKSVVACKQVAVLRAPAPCQISVKLVVTSAHVFNVFSLPFPPIFLPYALERAPLTVVEVTCTRTTVGLRCNPAKSVPFTIAASFLPFFFPFCSPGLRKSPVDFPRRSDG